MVVDDPKYLSDPLACHSCLCHSIQGTLASLLLTEPANQASTPGPLHVLFPLLRIPSPDICYVTPSFLQVSAQLLPSYLK